MEKASKIMGLPYMLEALGKEIDDDGNIIESDNGESLLTNTGEKVKFTEFGLKNRRIFKGDLRLMLYDELPEDEL